MNSPRKEDKAPVNGEKRIIRETWINLREGRRNEFSAKGG
jgi:hypothetical protein